MKLYEAVGSCCEAVVNLYESRMFVGILKIEKRIKIKPPNPKNRTATTSATQMTRVK